MKGTGRSTHRSDLFFERLEILGTAGATEKRQRTFDGVADQACQLEIVSLTHAVAVDRVDGREAVRSCPIAH